MARRSVEVRGGPFSSNVALTLPREVPTRVHHPIRLGQFHDRRWLEDPIKNPYALALVSSQWTKPPRKSHGEMAGDADGVISRIPAIFLVPSAVKYNGRSLLHRERTMTRRTGLLVLGVTMLTCSTGLSVPLEDPKRETKTDGNPAVVSPDGKTAVTAKGGVITISEVRGDNVVVRAKIKQRGNVNCLAISPDGKLLISGGDNISFFDMATGKTVIRINAGSPVVKLQLSADGTLLTSTHEDGKSRLFDSRTGKLLRVSE